MTRRPQDTRRGILRPKPNVAAEAEAEAAPAPAPAPLVADRYRLERLLGVGGLGKVYLATQVQLQRPVALKMLHPELSGRADLMERFEREARAASRLVHPGSVVVYDHGSYEGQLYIAMEFVDGETLASLVGREFPLATERIVDLGRQLCAVLGAAHDLGLLHRDLKPENVLITLDRDGHERVKLVDFGLAYLFRDTTQQRLTREGTVSGTPAFMAPEQALDKPLDPRSDLYALGCVLYEMVTKHVPFEAPSTLETMTMHLYEPPVPPSQRVRHVISKPLEAAILWALQKAPKNRPQSAAELAQALAAALAPPPAARETLEREARARAASLAPMAPVPRDPYAVDRTPSDGSTAIGVGLVEIPAPAGRARPSDAVSAAMVLRAHGWDPTPLAPDQSHRAPPTDLVVLVIDLRLDPTAGLTELRALTAGRPRDAVPIIVVGPDDDFAVMSGALAAGVADYVPESTLETIGRKVRRAAERSRR